MYIKWHLLEKAELNIYFPNYFPGKLPGKLHYPQDYPKLLEQRKILFSFSTAARLACFGYHVVKDAFGRKVVMRATQMIS